jgi:2-polyprenyl-3-methyl-5-hydroxy-6-metoxy-1,4-benzoquinol methylase
LMVDPAEQASCAVDLEGVTFGGERVSHLYPNDCYYAHLSIYYFASQFAQNGCVMDAGSGAGYGSACLADHGAKRVLGVDVSPQAVAFSQHYLPRSNAEYRVMDLQQISGCPTQQFDLVVSSNVLEHLPDVAAFLRAVWRLVRPEGALLVAVPPVTSDADRAANLANPYHLNIWTPRQWHHAISEFFGHIESYRHTVARPDTKLDFGNSPEQSVISEKDFAFEAVPLERFFEEPTLTVVFVARAPRPANELPPSGDTLEFVDDSYTRSFVSPNGHQGASDTYVQPSAEQPGSSSWRQLLLRAWAILRLEGVWTLLHRSACFLLRGISAGISHR